MKAVSIHTDGSCKGNPGAGGFAAILSCEEHTREVTGGEPHTTNNRMELRAILAGLEAITKPAAITIYTDSLYALGVLSGNKAKTNLDLILACKLKAHALIEAGSTIAFAHVAGHAGDPLNERADKLASQAARQQQPAAYPNDQMLGAHSTATLRGMAMHPWGYYDTIGA